MDFFKLEWGPRQRKLVVIQAPLDVEVRFHEVHVALTLGAHNGLVVNAQTRTDAFKGLGDEGAAAVGKHVLGHAIAQTRGIEYGSATQLASEGATAPASMVRE